MNTIQKIMNVLMNPNAELTNIISIPCTLIEIILHVNISLTLLNKPIKSKTKYLCIFSIYILIVINRLIVSSPYNVILNVLIFIFMYLLFFKTQLLESCISSSSSIFINSII